MKRSSGLPFLLAILVATLGCSLSKAGAAGPESKSDAPLNTTAASDVSTANDCASTTEPGEIRRQIENAYAANEAAFSARDVEAVMRLRHPDFHTIDHSGKLSTRQQMEERTRLFIGRIEHFDMLRETIQELEVHGDTAIARVLQETSRAQRLGDDALHRVDTTVTQREWWRCTSTGWQLWRVDEVAESTLLVDGKPPN